MRVTWRSIAPVFADVVVSPWNLLVGGILIQQLSLIHAIFSIVFGYTILSLVFILYGGLGFKKRQQSSQLLASVFGSKFVKYIIPLILAFGQIGWAAINMDLGGRSLGTLFSFPWYVGIGLYALLLIAVATLNLSKLGITKVIITLSSLSLMGYLFITKLHGGNFIQFIHYQPSSENSLFWGVSIVVASLISFATITPDFFQSVKTKNDVVLSTVVGLIPGMFVAMLGCFLFYNTKNLDLIPILTLTAVPLFPHIFNSITNTDGSTAIYTPGLKLQSILPITFKQAILLSGSISFLLALTKISLHMTLWLNILSILFPILIGVCFSAFLFKKITTKTLYHKEVIAAFLFTFLIAVSLTWFFPPVLISLLAPILFFTLTLGFINLSIL